MTTDTMPDDTEPVEPASTIVGEHRRPLRQAAIITAAVGAAHAVLFLLAFWLLLGVPRAGASSTEISEFYVSAQSRRVTLAGLYVMPFAGIAFVWFIVALRMWVEGTARRTNILLSNIQLVAGTIYVALFFAAGASISVLAASVEFSGGRVDPHAIYPFPDLGNALLFVFAFRMAAMFVLATTTIARASGILPRWFIWLGYGVGLFLLLSATFEAWFAAVFPLWLLLLSVLLFQRARAIPPERQVSADG
jgi:hypothetical protein